MSLQDKIKKIINVISDTDINEIEITSFWGAQKIRLSKSLKTSSNERIVESKVKEVIIDSSKTENLKAVEEPSKLEVKKNDPLVSSKVKEENATKSYSEEELTYQKAPLVGTFYSSAKPGEPTFVKEGDEVVKGQVICIIEAMKIFNEIESDFDGTIVEILIEDQNPVEFNQSMFSIKEK